MTMIAVQVHGNNRGGMNRARWDLYNPTLE
jgi:hypothetical protein